MSHGTALSVSLSDLPWRFSSFPIQKGLFDGGEPLDMEQRKRRKSGFRTIQLTPRGPSLVLNSKLIAMASKPKALFIASGLSLQCSLHPVCSLRRKSSLRRCHPRCHGRRAKVFTAPHACGQACPHQLKNTGKRLKRGALQEGQLRLDRCDLFELRGSVYPPC